MEKEKLIEIYFSERSADEIATIILSLHNAEIAKYKELVETYKQEKYYFTRFDNNYAEAKESRDKVVELRRKIAKLESEVGK